MPRSARSLARHRLVDYDEAKDAMQRGIKENRRGGGPYNPNYADK
jgi:hypothetical protein